MKARLRGNLRPAVILTRSEAERKNLFIIGMRSFDCVTLRSANARKPVSEIASRCRMTTIKVVEILRVAQDDNNEQNDSMGILRMTEKAE